MTLNLIYGQLLLSLIMCVGPFIFWKVNGSYTIYFWCMNHTPEDHSLKNWPISGNCRVLNRVSQGYPQPAIVTSSDWLASTAFPDWLRNQNTYLLQSAINPFILPILTHNKPPEALMCANRDSWTWKLINRWHTCYPF